MHIRGHKVNPVNIIVKTAKEQDFLFFIYFYTLLFLSITNKMQRYAIFFITVNAPHVSGGFSAHHQELKNCTHSIGYMSSLLAANGSS